MEAAQASLSLHLSKCHIVGKKHMSRLIYFLTRNLFIIAGSKQRVLFESKTHKDFSRKPVTEVQCNYMIAILSINST